MVNKTVGIITIDDYTNYGNRLQNYALTKLIEREGYNVVNGIRVITKEDWINRTESPLKKKIKQAIPYWFYKHYIYKSPKEKTGLLKSREENFLKFISDYTTLIEPVISATHVQANKILEPLGIDYYIVGSDQVWNPYFGGKEYEFLTFTESTKRYSFAASIGVDNLPENVKGFYKKDLLKFRYLSVREEQAALVIKDLVNREVDVTLDPTLLLEKSEWDKIIKKPSIKIDKQYICAYFLGEVPKAVYSFSEKEGLPIYFLNDINYRELFIIEPREFLYILKNAEFVLTDSFHGTAFSIKFHKEFYVFRRQGNKATNLFSRIESITRRFGLESRVQERVQIENQVPINNWDQIDKELLAEAKTSIRKLINTMEQQDENKAYQ